ncbi:hypothetical protein NF556_09865 [Ornithinimicrobium faecis]|uniref:Tetratricopeptide repeat protein n=1 Tax=Ornithinimicrobium faecis TaxID=2934158 RepID=A0ABY4YYT7_9MICO|nr:hypothetical protein [Ornithinimicrobium sp. HY1793]USQ81922.1 hypothetical protein NF556_09865 [Ornithinimicrobium sp. HY1793]
MREPIDLDWLDRFDEGLADSSRAAHAEAATQLVARAADPHEQDGAWVGDILLRAAFQFSEAGDVEGALAQALRSSDAGISEGADPRAFATELLFLLERPDDAKATSEDLRRSRPVDPETYWTMATIWEARGETKQALAWYNRGIALVEDSDGPPADLGLLCSGRWRVRRSLGLDPDELDELGMGFEEAVAEHQDET